MSSQQKKWVGAGIALISIIVAGYWYANRTIAVHDESVEGFTPIRDAELAERFAPALLVLPDFEKPEHLLYRASRDSQGRVHIVYHFVWAYERNNAAGWGPWLNRHLYTGGLSLQKTMFGEGDIEMVAIVLDPGRNRIVELTYETAEAYEPDDFSVKHKTITMSEGEFQEPLIFEIISWNHLFDYRYPDEPGLDEGYLTRITPEYFTKSDWERYEMFKAEETLLSRNRAHLPFEREVAQ